MINETSAPPFDGPHSDHDDKSRRRNFGQFDKWIFCLTAASMIAANQELR